MITVIATIEAKEEKIFDVLSELRPLILSTLEEQGCNDYRVHQDVSDPAKFMFYESWENKQYLDAHIETRHFKNFVKISESLLKVGFQVEIYEATI